MDVLKDGTVGEFDGGGAEEALYAVDGGEFAGLEEGDYGVAGSGEAD